jgi:glycosyltransferase involved in cell wall biosynthesis
MNSFTLFSEKFTLKVLMTDASPNWGGQQYRLVREAVWLRERGHEVVVVCGERSRLAQYLERNAPEMPLEKVPSWGSPRTFLRLAAFVRRWRPDLVHMRSGLDSTWGAFFHLTGWPVVRSRHMTIPERVSLRDTVGYRAGCRRVIAAAHFIKRDLIDHVGVSDSRVDVVGEGANLEEFHPGLDGGGFRAEFEIPPRSPLFGVVAMMRPEKGQRTFINAAASVLKFVPDARFVIVGGGGGAYVDKLHEKIRRKFPQGSSPVKITGYREDVSRVMAALDVVVVPSLHDAQTIVIPEAFASGKPVIASRVGGIPELVIHEENGLLVQPGDNNALASAMLRLLENPVLRNELANAGLGLARRELSFEKKAELLLDAYNKAGCRNWENAASFPRESSPEARASRMASVSAASRA